MGGPLESRVTGKCSRWGKEVIVSDAEIIKVSDSKAWVRCASGNVY